MLGSASCPAPTVSRDQSRRSIAEPETQFDTPRWSPDGRTIAVERHRLGAMPEIVIVDVATEAVRVDRRRRRRTRFVTPAWRPDGGAIVAAAAPDDETFNLFEFSLDGSHACAS